MGSTCPLFLAWDKFMHFRKVKALCLFLHLHDNSLHIHFLKIKISVCFSDEKKEERNKLIRRGRESQINLDTSAWPHELEEELMEQQVWREGQASFLRSLGDETYWVPQRQARRTTSRILIFFSFLFSFPAFIFINYHFLSRHAFFFLFPLLAFIFCFLVLSFPGPHTHY